MQCPEGQTFPGGTQKKGLSKQKCLRHVTFLVAGSIDAVAISERGEPEDQYRCQMCSQTFPNIDLLYAHQNELGHLELKQTPRGPGYLCWKKGCNQYFKTASALQVCCHCESFFD